MKIRQKFNKHQLLKIQFIVVSLILFIAISAWLFIEVTSLEPASDWFESKSENTIVVTLPQDDAPHQDKMEWWYYNGHITSESGKEYSFHFTTFIVQDLISYIVKHVSLSDHQTGRHFTDQRRTTGGGISPEIENGFKFALKNWEMSGSDGKDRLIVKNIDFDLDLTLESTMPPVFHGNDGIIFLGQAGSSFYYSRTRMAISGTVKIDGKTEAVTGIAWFDHQWGDFATTKLAWAWFSLQLDEGLDVMIYQLHDQENNSMLYAGSITQNGITRMLFEDDFTITPLDTWTSKKTGYTYPIAWAINMPNKNINIKTRSIIESSEFDANQTTYNVYWEGAVSIEGTHTGKGFMELYGYTDKAHKSL